MLAVVAWMMALAIETGVNRRDVKQRVCAELGQQVGVGGNASGRSTPSCLSCLRRRTSSVGIGLGGQGNRRGSVCAAAMRSAVVRRTEVMGNAMPVARLRIPSRPMRNQAGRTAAAPFLRILPGAGAGGRAGARRRPPRRRVRCVYPDAAPARWSRSTPRSSAMRRASGLTRSAPFAPPALQRIAFRQGVLVLPGERHARRCGPCARCPASGPVDIRARTRPAAGARADGGRTAPAGPGGGRCACLKHREGRRLPVPAACRRRSGSRQASAFAFCSR